MLIFNFLALTNQKRQTDVIGLDSLTGLTAKMLSKCPHHRNQLI